MDPRIRNHKKLHSAVFGCPAEILYIQYPMYCRIISVDEGGCLHLHRSKAISLAVISRDTWANPGYDYFSVRGEMQAAYQNKHFKMSTEKIFLTRSIT
jgi:hypothetical protein